MQGMRAAFEGWLDNGIEWLTLIQRLDSDRSLPHSKMA